MATKKPAASKPAKKVVAKKKPALPTTADGGELLPPPTSDEVIEELVTELNGLQRDSGFGFARKVGNLILKKFYGGKADAWRARGTKDSSFRKLAERAEAGTLQLSASALYRCLAFVELEKRLGVSTWQHLTISHVRAVFGLPDEVQQKLLAQGEEKQWTVEDMDKAVAKIREKNADGRGRPPLPTFVKTVNKLEKFLSAGDDAWGELEKVEDLDEEEAKRLYTAVTGMKLKCEELQKAIAKKVPGFV